MANFTIKRRLKHHDLYYSEKILKYEFKIKQYKFEDITTPFKSFIKKIINLLILLLEILTSSLKLKNVMMAIQLDKKINNQKKIKEVTVNKYSQNRKGDLHESILIDNDPIFLNMDLNDGNTNIVDGIKLSISIIENSMLYPPSLKEYLHNPYEFSSIEEIKSFIKKAKNETIFALFLKAKSIVSKYIDQDEHIIKLISIDILFSYFQDRSNTTHYIAYLEAMTLEKVVLVMQLKHLLIEP